MTVLIGPPGEIPPFPVRRFSVAEYHRMVETGILTADDPVELIHGELFVMAPIGTRHAHCVDQLLDVFASLRPNARLRVQNPVTLEPRTSSSSSRSPSRARPWTVR